MNLPSYPEEENLLKSLLKAHTKSTNSIKATKILSEWKEWKYCFKVLIPPSEKQKMGITALKEVLA